MLLEIALGLIIGLIILWVLVEPLHRIGTTAWGVLFPLFNFKSVDLKSKYGEWAVVTGSTDGIGKAYAEELAARGLNLILISRNLEKLEKTKNEILKSHPKIEIKVIAADFSKGKEIYDTIASELKNYTIGILVNNVGTQTEYPMYLGEVPESVIWDLINVNVGAVTLMTRLVINDMKRRGKGAIVNVSSCTEIFPLAFMTVYSATKAYMRSFSEALRAEYQQFGITIHHLVPLYVCTKINAYSDDLQVSSLTVPTPTTYAKNAIKALGTVDLSNGYWMHGIQYIITQTIPMSIRVKIGHGLNLSLRDNYLTQKKL